MKMARTNARMAMSSAEIIIVLMRSCITPKEAYFTLQKSRLGGWTRRPLGVPSDPTLSMIL